MTLAEELHFKLAAIAGLRLEPGAELKHHTRFRLGGPCWLLADATTEAAFLGAYRLLQWSGLRWTCIAGGTNLIVNDDGYPGAVLRYSADTIKADGQSISVDAGAELNALIDYANDRSLGGLETMAGIPGWVGAAIYGNAGAYGQSISQRIVSVRFFDGQQVREFSNGECAFRYRHSIFKDHKHWQILSAKLGFYADSAEPLRQKSKEIRATRDAKFPPAMRCAGSIFKNLLLKDLPSKLQPEIPTKAVIEGKVPAAWFLEQVGAKGMRSGDIRVAEYHANLVYNEGAGTAYDLVTLLTELKQRVEDRFGLDIEEEVQYVGYDLDTLTTRNHGYTSAISSLLYDLRQYQADRKLPESGLSINQVLTEMIGRDLAVHQPCLRHALTEHNTDFPEPAPLALEVGTFLELFERYTQTRRSTAQLIELTPPALGPQLVVQRMLQADLMYLEKLASMVRELHV